MLKMSPKAAITRRLALSVIVVMATTTAGFAQRATDPDAVYESLLARHVVASPDGVNRVDYARWLKSTEDRKALDGYIANLAARKPSAMSRDEAFAYWGNLYNAITLSHLQNSPSAPDFSS